MSIVFILLTAGGLFKYFGWAKKQPSVIKEVAYGGGGVLTLFCLLKLPKFLKWYRKQNILVKGIVVLMLCGFAYGVYYLKTTFDLDYSMVGTIVLGSMLLLSTLKPKKIKKKAKKAFKSAKESVDIDGIKSRAKEGLNSEKVAYARSKLNEGFNSERVVYARSKINEGLKSEKVSSVRTKVKSSINSDKVNYAKNKMRGMLGNIK